MIIGDLAHAAVSVAVYVVLMLLLVFVTMVRVIGWKSMFRRRRPRRDRSPR